MNLTSESMKRVIILLYGLAISMTISSIIYFSRSTHYHIVSSKQLLDKGGAHTSLLESYENLKSWNGSKPGTQIIILTYMRSGSTLIGRLFEHHSDVFYVFEPMHSLKWIWGNAAMYLIFWNQLNRYVKTLDDFKREAIDIATEFLKCRFVDIDISTLLDHIQCYSDDTYAFQICLAKHGGGVSNLLKCLDILYQKCSNSSVSVLKTIQFPMSAAEEMMMTNPALKVIHLIRDPRPTIRSQIMAEKSRWSELPDTAKAFCDRVNEDLEATERIMMKYPERVKLLLYEDLSMKPMKHVKELYSFAGLDYDYEETEQFVKSLTDAKVDEKVYYLKMNMNSSKHAFQWRQQMSYPDALTIDMNCMSVYTKLGYVPVQNEKHLRDLAGNLKTEGTMSSIHKGKYIPFRFFG